MSRVVVLADLIIGVAAVFEVVERPVFSATAEVRRHVLDHQLQAAIALADVVGPQTTLRRCWQHDPGDLQVARLR